MKRVVAILIALFVLGCTPQEPTVAKPEIPDRVENISKNSVYLGNCSVYVFRMDGHDYFSLSSSEYMALFHAARCPCGRGSELPIVVTGDSTVRRGK